MRTFERIFYPFKVQKPANNRNKQGFGLDFQILFVRNGEYRYFYSVHSSVGRSFAIIAEKETEPLEIFGSSHFSMCIKRRQEQYSTIRLTKSLRRRDSLQVPAGVPRSAPACFPCGGYHVVLSLGSLQNSFRGINADAKNGKNQEKAELLYDDTLRLRFSFGL